jgi:hypothetical protein
MDDGGQLETTRGKEISKWFFKYNPDIETVLFPYIPYGLFELRLESEAYFTIEHYT